VPLAQIRLYLITSQDSNPSSPTSNDIPLFTFKSNASGHSEQKRAAHDKDKSPHPPAAFTIKLNNTPSQTMKAPALKKGILKHSGNEMKWRPSNSTETSSCHESASSDAENPSSGHAGNLRIVACSRRLDFAQQRKAKRGVRVGLREDSPPLLSFSPLAPDFSFTHRFFAALHKLNGDRRFIKWTQFFVLFLFLFGVSWLNIRTKCCKACGTGTEERYYLT